MEGTFLFPVRSLCIYLAASGAEVFWGFASLQLQAFVHHLVLIDQLRSTQADRASCVSIQPVQCLGVDTRQSSTPHSMWRYLEKVHDFSCSLAAKQNLSEDNTGGGRISQDVLFKSDVCEGIYLQRVCSSSGLRVAADVAACLDGTSLPSASESACHCRCHIDP